MRIPDPFGFPNPVNEKAARAVAGGVALSTLVMLCTGWLWLSVPLAAGFLARVIAGPRFSPFGQLATRVLAGHLGPAVMVPGPPKRFAQMIGLILSCVAVIAVSTGVPIVAIAALILITIAAVLESVFAVCLGCVAFGWLMRTGVIPPETCEACNSVGVRAGIS